MRKVIRIDETGLFIEDVILQNTDEVPTDCIETPCEEGFILPKWDGEKWVEGGTAPVQIYDDFEIKIDGFTISEICDILHWGGII